MDENLFCRENSKRGQHSEWAIVGVHSSYPSLMGKRTKNGGKVGEMVLFSRKRNWFRVKHREAEETAVFVEETVTINMKSETLH